MLESSYDRLNPSVVKHPESFEVAYWFFLEQRKKRASIPIDNEDTGLSNRLKADKNFDENKAEWKLQLAMQQLPEKQRAVFNLRYYDEMPYSEMSRILDTSEGALKASYHHAVKKIEDYILNH